MFGTKISGRSWRRRGIALGGLAAFVGVFVGASAIPAWAHDSLVSGQSVCSDGAHVITWAIGNSDVTHTMHIDSATAALGTEMFAAIGYSDVSGAGPTFATTTVPGGLTGDVTLTVIASWSDGFQNSATASVTLESGCSPTTTSTTVETTTTQASTTTTEASTTTTEAPTTTTEATTSTTIESATSTSSTPIVTEGTTAPPTTMISPVTVVGSTVPVTAAATPSGSLPFTGNGDSGPLIGVGSLVAGAVALVIARRRR